MTGRARPGEGLAALGKQAVAVCLFLAGLGFASDASAQVRDPYGVAVIIGNRDYEEPGLSNVDYAVRDAQAFERYVLDVLGLDPKKVLVLENATRRQMSKAFGRPGDPPGGPSDLWALLDTEGRSDVSVFYSGHGAPGLDDGKGYLLPVDVPARFAQDEGYPIAALYERLAALRAATGRSAKSARVYLDACFSGQSPGGSVFVGASPVFPTAALPEAVADGVAVLSAGGVDQLASWDEDAGHGMFTHHLLDALYGGGDANGDGRVTAKEAEKYLYRHMTQAAWLRHSVVQRASLSMAPSSVPVVLSMAPPGGFPERPVLVSGEALEEAQKADDAAWERARSSDTASAYADYLSVHPSGRHVSEARRLRDAALERERSRAVDDAAWERARSSDTASAYADYLSAHPSGRHVSAARRLRDAALERERSRAVDDAAWGRARSSDTASAYADYLSAHPSGRHVSAARRLRDAALERERSPDPPHAVAEKSLGLSREERVGVQRGLESAGGSVGSADGIFGPRTRAALRAWQENRGLTSTGYLTRDQADALVALGRDAALEPDPGPEIGYVFRDCADCPAMVVVPSGSFMMGSPPSEEGRDDDEGPVHRVSIPSAFAVGVYEVTRGEFGRFVSSTGRSMGNECWYWQDEWKKGSGRSWLSPGFSQTDLHPAVCVSWDDARAYVAWLSRETGEAYRLLSESEWEYVARAGTRTRYHWGDAIGRNLANCRDCGSRWDGGKGTSPVGVFGANAFGLHDVHGNVFEWVEDCWNESYAGAPRDGSAWKGGDCSRHVLRGGSWDNDPRDLRAANRDRYVTGNRSNNVGFRVARTFTP